MTTVVISAANPWVGPAIVAAGIAGLISLLTVGLTQRRARQDRQRQLFGEAFAVVQAYKEYPFIVRRRRADDVAAERIRISTALSEVQQQLNHFAAVLRVEDAHVGRAYAQLVQTTRDVAGPQIAAGWDLAPVDADKRMHVRDVDLTAITPAEDGYLLAVADHLADLPARARRWIRQRKGEATP